MHTEKWKNKPLCKESHILRGTMTQGENCLTKVSARLSKFLQKPALFTPTTAGLGERSGLHQRKWGSPRRFQKPVRSCWLRGSLCFRPWPQARLTQLSAPAAPRGPGPPMLVVKAVLSRCSDAPLLLRGSGPPLP